MSRVPRTFRGIAGTSRGFSLLEMAVVLVILGLIAVAILAVIPRVTERMRLNTDENITKDASEAIYGFALKNHRLPCPDVNGDGLEGTGGTCASTDAVGAIPYRSLGLLGPVLDKARLPLRYGVYRNSGASADLVTLTNLYEPDIPGALTENPGTVSGCGALPAGTVQLSYKTDSSTTLTVTGSSGSFNVGDIVSGSTLDYNNVVNNTPVVPVGGVTNCPCGHTATACTQCTNFVAGERVYLQGNTSTQSPNATIDSVVNSGTRLILPFPTANPTYTTDSQGNTVLTSDGQFHVGDTVVGSETGVQATVTAFYFPGSAKINSIVTAGQTFDVTLTPPNIPSSGQDWSTAPPAPGFVSGQKLFSTPGGGTATYSSLQTSTATPFQVGETVNGSPSGASGTVQSDDGTTMTLTGVSGSFSAGDPTHTDSGGNADPISGDTITGATSGATGTVVSVSTDGRSEPTVTYGSITISDPNVTPSNQLNELDFCKALRNGFLSGPSTSEIHTVNDSNITINPAFLVVSGGVEDAVPGDVAFDGLNTISNPLDFNSPAMRRDANYDDVVNAAPFQVLDARLSCPRNLAAVNALAVSATVAQNIAISTFNNHENALSNIDATWAALKLAKANVAIQAFMVAESAAECLKAVNEAIDDFGVSTAWAAAGGCASAVAGVVNFAFAIDALTKAQDSYDFSCTDELSASAQRAEAQAAATTALSEALEADQKEGVK